MRARGTTDRAARRATRERVDARGVMCGDARRRRDGKTGDLVRLLVPPTGTRGDLGNIGDLGMLYVNDPKDA